MWPRFGFGFVEIGTVTAEAQPGNPRPRVFRYPSERALINRLGFNSEGATTVSDRLAVLRRESPTLAVPLGVNIGKSRNVAGETPTLEDYRTSLRKLNRFADYIVVNVSSPNTPGLRQWQERTHIEALLATLVEESQVLAAKRDIPAPPMFVKISPDMADADMADVCDVAMELKLGGIIATNTTIAREGPFENAKQAGGLSGSPLKARATEVIRWLYRYTHGQIPLIGVGGISSAEDAYERIRAGASLIQIYTALIYQGPYLPQSICQGLVRLMERDSIHSISDLVGIDAK
jgi:dihydroorotate dehydrogenase